MSAKITTYLFKSDDYFVAVLDNSGVRIGLAASYSTDIPTGHEMFEMVVACGNSGNAEAIENLSDEIYSIHLQGGDCRVLLTA